nr:zinc finger, CCHC-type [Tanacetum cinerariifolium]
MTLLVYVTAVHITTINKGLFEVFLTKLNVMGTTADFTWGSDFVHLGSITTWEDLTTRFLAQFFPPGRTVKLRNDILMFQQHHEESLSEAWTRFKDLL